MGKSLKNLHSKAECMSEQACEPSKEDISKVEARAEKYRGMSEGQLMNELVNKYNQEKDTESFNPEELEKFYGQMSPFLSFEQRNKMRQLINMLRSKK